FGIESTVVALDRAEPRLLRAGALPRAAIEELIGPLSDGLSAGPAQSPGQHKRHYAPAGVVRLASRARLAEVAASLQGRVGALLHGGQAPAAAAVVRLPDDAAGYARELYAGLRELEDAECAAIVIEEVPEAPEWAAVHDRLQRAAAQ
ncbi:MAG TPA: Sua5 family C-terminal domain-containing protein, partial [Myxococcales bacterium]|nr:Sua5 family C-terminal domain-containing protein [Myxococcales bacterium]